MRRVVAILAVLGGTLWLPGHAFAAPHSFDGSCQITGTVAFDSYQSERFYFSGSGACTGLLDGQIVQDTPVAVETDGEVRGFTVPILGYSAGSFEFTDAGVSFPIAVQQLGTVLRVYPACMGCSGVAFGALEPLTQPQPAPSPWGPSSTITVVTQTVRTFTTP